MAQGTCGVGVDGHIQREELTKHVSSFIIRKVKGCHNENLVSHGSYFLAMKGEIDSGKGKSVVSKVKSPKFSACGGS